MRKTATPIALQTFLLWLYFATALLAGPILHPRMNPWAENPPPPKPTDESVGGKFSRSGGSGESVGEKPPNLETRNPRMNPWAENFPVAGRANSLARNLQTSKPETRNPQTPNLETQLQYTARGTGRTTGHIATLFVSNPTPVPMRTVVGDLFIPSDQDYQGYVVLQTYPVDVMPFSTVRVPLEGYCTNAQRPPVPDGGAMPDVSQWVSWAEADPLPEPGKTPAPAFFPVPDVAPTDPLALTYPGTSIPFPYRIDFNRNPGPAARLLLHAAFAAGAAFDQLVREGKLRPAAPGRSPEAFRRDMIQQTLWAYAARLEGKGWDKTVFAGQLTEEAEQLLNRPAASFPAETQQQVDRETQDLWAGISLVGASAKLIPVAADHPTDIFQENPSGPPSNPTSALSRILDNTDPTRPDAPDRLVPALVFLQKNDTTPTLQAFRHSAREKWKTWLNQRAIQVNPGSETTIRDILVLLGYLQAAPGGALPEDERRTLAGTLIGKLNTHIQTRAQALQPSDPAYLGAWRTMKSWQNTRWYADYCTAANPLKNLPTAQPTRSATAFNPANLALTGASWKHVFPPVPGAGPKKFPWWIPAVAAGGGVAYLLLGDKDGGSTPQPTPPVAVPDALSLPCNGQSVVSVLANDTGEGLTVTAVSGTAGISVSVSGNTGVLVASTGVAGVFSASYTITDKAGQTATGSIAVTVTDQAAPVIVCPPGITLEGCGQPPAPAVSGQATATDDCGPAPTVGFADELSGTACDRVISRSWSAVDASEKNAVCTQTIHIRDQTPPALTCPVAVTVPLGQQNDPAATGLAVATDGCTSAVEPTFVDDLSGFGPCGGIIVRNWTAADACTNTATCAQTITVQDQKPPEISCPGPAEVECGKQNDLSLTGQATGQDDCAGPITPTFADTPPVFSGCSGAIARTWTAADPGGNSATCQQEITVTDKSAPVFTTCPPTVSVLCGQQNDLDITGKAAAQDACNGASPPVHTDNTSGFSGCSGVIVRTFSSADSCANTATCQQTITVFDNVPPVFSTCPQPVNVYCGQQNNLNTTGMAAAADACSGPAPITHTDDLSEFSACEGLIWRTFVATDLCGNTATCLQAITVVNVPCSFTPLFAFSPAVCGDCNGAVSTTMSPPGSYSYQWETGDTGPHVPGLCPGPISVTITDNVNECTNIFTPEVPDVPMLVLTVLQTIPPSGPSSNDGRVVLQVGPPSAQLPFLVFVNGNPIGTANTFTFQITNLPAGEYEIYVVDDFGQGCASNTVFVVLLPENPPPAGPEIGFESPWFSPVFPALPEYPGGVSGAVHVVWGMSVGISAGIPLGNLWQLRLDATRQAGWVTGTGFFTAVPLQADRLTAGLRHYFPMRASRLAFFQENSVAHSALRVNLPSQLPVRGQWQLSTGGGLRFSLENMLRVDLSGSLMLDFAPEGLRFSPAFQVRAHLILRQNNTQKHRQ